MSSELPRLLLAGIIVGILALASGQAQTPAPDSGHAVLYSATGAVLTQYDVDTAAPALIKRNSIRLPANVQYAWPHPSRKYFYVAWSDGGAAAAAPGTGTVPSGKLHGVSAFRVDPSSGALQPIGEPVAIASRPIHMSVDISGTHILVAYNDPSSITVHRLNGDGTIGALVKQSAMLDTGIYAHQVRVAPSNHTVILVTRGNAATKDKPEDRGALKVFDYADGILKNRASIAPDGGVNFQPRHLDFHPSKPWVFVSLERQSKLQVYQMKDGSLGATPLFTRDSLAAATPRGSRQAAGTIHMHPNGRFVYQANRSGIAEGSENSIAVYAINQQTGEPTLIQSADTHGTSPRTFALDPNARVLVAGNQSGVANLALFRIGNDGKLDFVRKYDVDSNSGSLFWMGIVPLP